jgi:hypothetical protein
MKIMLERCKRTSEGRMAANFEVKMKISGGMVEIVLKSQRRGRQSDGLVCGIKSSAGDVGASWYQCGILGKGYRRSGSLGR